MKTPIRQLWRWLGLAFLVAIVAMLTFVIRQQTEEIPQPSQVVQPNVVVVQGPQAYNLERHGCDEPTVTWGRAEIKD